MFGMNDPFGLNNQINSMMNNHFMMDPFGMQQHQQRGSRGNNQQVQQRNNNNTFDPFANMMSPFQQHSQMMSQHNPFALMNQMMMGGGMMGGGGNPFAQTIHADPNSQVFSSSTVMSYSNSADGKPVIYQESKQMRQGPGGVKETREMIRDSQKGIEKVSVGHHIGDRAHVIERQKVNGSQIEEIVNLENLDDEEVNQFNQEFENKIRASHSHHSSNHHHRSHPHSINSNQPFAIEDVTPSSNRHSKKDSRERKSKSKPKH